jgi:hypothetical protein
MQNCARKKCTASTDHVSGYCSDICLGSDHDVDLPPVTVLALNKAGGFGTSLHWAARTPVQVAPVLPEGYE